MASALPRNCLLLLRAHDGLCLAHAENRLGMTIPLANSVKAATMKRQG